MIEQLSQASFKGVTFPCNDASTTVGRAQIKHRFANSNKNSIEDQGLEPRIYSLTAIFQGEDYFQSRDRLLAAIEEGGKGVLIHPFYGRIESAVARPVQFDESVTSLGRVEIPLTFDLDESEGIPVKGFDSQTEITQKKDTLLSGLSDQVGSSFNVTNSFTGNFQSAQSKLIDFSNAIKANVTTATIDATISSAYNAAVESFTDSINTLIGDPVALGEEITGLIGGITGLYESPDQILSVAGKFFDFGDTDTAITQTTAGLIERALNSETLNTVIQCMLMTKR